MAKNTNIKKLLFAKKIIALIEQSLFWGLKIFFGVAYQHQVVKFKHLEFKQNFFYLITMIFTHHLILFSLEVFSFAHINIIFKKTISSLIFSFILVIIFFEFFIKKSK